ncbi:MAG: type II toxin-antitoxin system VapB family antitoxin [Pseudomonadota bacterium]
MRTHVELDEKVLQQVMNMGQFSSKKAAIQTALSELSRSLKRRQLLALRGQLQWQGNLDALRVPRSEPENDSSKALV